MPFDLLNKPKPISSGRPRVRVNGVRVSYTKGSGGVTLRLGADVVRHTGITGRDRYEVWRGNGAETGFFAIRRATDQNNRALRRAYTVTNGHPSPHPQYPRLRWSGPQLGVSKRFKSFSAPCVAGDGGVVTIDLRRILPMEASAVQTLAAEPIIAYPEMGSGPFVSAGDTMTNGRAAV